MEVEEAMSWRWRFDIPIGCPRLQQRRRGFVSRETSQNIQPLFRHLKILLFPLNTNKPPPIFCTGKSSRATAHGWIDHHLATIGVSQREPFHERQRFLRRVIALALVAGEIEHAARVTKP